jgi:hypothetical protein
VSSFTAAVGILAPPPMCNCRNIVGRDARTGRVIYYADTVVVAGNVHTCRRCGLPCFMALAGDSRVAPGRPEEYQR